MLPKCVRLFQIQLAIFFVAFCILAKEVEGACSKKSDAGYPYNIVSESDNGLLRFSCDSSELKSALEEGIYGLLGKPCELKDYTENALPFWKDYFSDLHMMMPALFASMHWNLSVDTDNFTFFDPVVNITFNVNNNKAFQTSVCFTGGLMECGLEKNESVAKCRCMTKPIATVLSLSPVKGCYINFNNICRRNGTERTEQYFSCGNTMRCDPNKQICVHPRSKSETLVITGNTFLLFFLIYVCNYLS